MILTKYVVITKMGRDYSPTYKAEMKERLPNLAGNQIAMKLSIEVPSGIFEKPLLEAVMKIPQEAVPKVTITADVTTNIERIIKDQLGLDMKVGIVEHEKEMPYVAADKLDREGDFSNLQEFKKGQKVRFWPAVKDPDYAGIHIVTEVEKVELGHVIKTDRLKDWVHVHWFAPSKK